MLHCLLQESLRESSSQVNLLQQRERERDLELERERERQRERDRAAQALREVEVKVQALVQQGLLRMERSPSGHLDVQVVPVIQNPTQKGQIWYRHMFVLKELLKIKYDENLKKNTERRKQTE